MRKKIAELTSNILNPILTGVVLLLVVSFESATDVFDAVKWALISIALSIVPLCLAAIYLARVGRLGSIFANIRSQRTTIYILAITLSGVGCIILHCLAAPLILSALFLTAFLLGLIFLCINFWWKVSLHTASAATLMTVVVILYGFVAAASVVLIPLLAWARVELGYHSLAQGMTGVFLATSILVLVFHFLGLI